MSAHYIRNRVIGFTRDPAAALRALPRLRQIALDSGYPDAEIWCSWLESELHCALGTTGARAFEPDARQVEILGTGNQVVGVLIRCYKLAIDREWQALLEASREGLQLLREAGSMWLLEPCFLAHLGDAQFALGNFQASRTAAQEGVTLMRESRSSWEPRCYAVLTRAQLALAEQVVDITATLDEYAALLARTAFALYEGELYELRAQLAEREGHEPENVAALQRAFDSYTRFGMTAQAARIAAAMVLAR